MAVKVRPSDEVVQENIKKWNIPQPDKEYTVLIHCTTYNHGQYIEDALKGFVMQKTNFPFCAIIIDDCSTDNNAEIIKRYAEKYPDIIKPILLGENHMQHGLLRDPYFEKWHQSAKYIAQCEGDDYWIDPLKLQKQKDFLESHQDYSMCFHNAKLLNETESHFSLIKVEDRDYNIDEMFQSWVAPTASFFAKRDVVINLPIDNRIINGDLNFVLNSCTQGKVRGMSDVMSVYRLQSNGLTIKRAKDNMLELQQKYLGHYTALKELYPGISSAILKKKYADTYINIGILYLKSKAVKGFYYLVKGLVKSPLRFCERMINLIKKM